MFSCKETYDSVDIVCSNAIKYNILLILSNISMFKDIVTVRDFDSRVQSPESRAQSLESRV